MNLLLPECVHFRTCLPGSCCGEEAESTVETDPHDGIGSNSLKRYGTEVEHEQAHSEGRGRIRYPPSEAERSCRER